MMRTRVTCLCVECCICLSRSRKKRLSSPGVLLAWLALSISTGAHADQTAPSASPSCADTGSECLLAGDFREGDLRQAGKQEGVWASEGATQQREAHSFYSKASRHCSTSTHPRSVQSSAQLQPTSRSRSQHRIAPSFLCAAQSPVFGRSALRRRVSYHVWCAAPLQYLGSMG